MELSTRRALTTISDALGAVDHPERAGISADARLELVADARVVLRRLQALVAVLIAEADDAGASLAARGTPTTSWLTLDGTAPGEAAALVFGGRDVVRHAPVTQAALAGAVSLRQARLIEQVMGLLPEGLDVGRQAEAARILVGMVRRLDPKRPERAVREVLAQVAPEALPTPEDEQRRLEAQRVRAWGRRELTFSPDGDGSVRFRGCLPVLEAAPLVKLVDAYVEAGRRAAREPRAGGGVGSASGAGGGDVSGAGVGHVSGAGGGRSRPGSGPEGGWASESGSAGLPTPAQRRADALVALIAAQERGQRAPAVGGDRPRVVVVMQEAELRARAEQAGVLDDGTQLSAGELRRLCCDADLAPVVLGGASEVLDVGTTARLVTPPIRRALSLRDGGCVFPGCDVAADSCEAHHIVPWWAGGKTALANLVLVCPHHHALVEPPRFWSGPPPDRWQVRLDERGRPEILPPERLAQACRRGPPSSAA